MHIFLLFPDICFGNSLVAPHRAAANEYPQEMFSLRKNDNVKFQASKSWLAKWILSIYLSVDK